MVQQAVGAVGFEYMFYEVFHDEERRYSLDADISDRMYSRWGRCYEGNTYVDWFGLILGMSDY